jgi:hypothetical protein
MGQTGFAFDLVSGTYFIQDIQYGYLGAVVLMDQYLQAVFKYKFLVVGSSKILGKANKLKQSVIFQTGIVLGNDFSLN